MIAPPLAAQVSGGVDIGVSLVEYEGFLDSGAVVVAPLVRFDSPRLSLAGQGSWTVFESGNDVIQGTAAAAWLIGQRGSPRLELLGALGASRYRAEPSTGYLVAGLRAHLFRTTSGGWIGASAATSSEIAGVPLELAASGWLVRSRFTLVGTLTTVLRDEVRQLDVVGAVRWNGWVELEAKIGARPWARDPDPDGKLTGAYGEISAKLPLTRRLGLSFSGGQYPSDPLRGTLGARYVSAGFQFSTSRPRAIASTKPGQKPDWVVPTNETGPRLDLRGSGEQRILRIAAPGAQSIEVMGDFTDWLPLPLRRVARDWWEVELALPAGVYRVNVRIDGGAWTTPAGLRSEGTEFGDTVGILVVP